MGRPPWRRAGARRWRPGRSPSAPRRTRAWPPLLCALLGAMLGAMVAGPMVAGCVHVAPYEREALSQPGMDLEREEAEAGFRSHVHDSREGATGGQGSTGGGCGCN